MTPTARNYGRFDEAYDFFNRALFGGRLPRCIVTLQRGRKYYGYFAPGRFGADGATVDEIAMNPSHFANRSVEDVLSTLVHEMTHLEQQHFGKPSRNGYHNAAWGALMRRVGLEPSSTGQPGGKTTGQKVSHWIVKDGPYARAVADLLAEGFKLAYFELWGDQDAVKAKKKAASKTKYTCPCCAANAWAKPSTKLVCGDCDEPMVAEDGDLGEADEVALAA